MAATRIMSIHINKGKTARQCIGERLDYIMNPKRRTAEFWFRLTPAHPKLRRMSSCFSVRNTNRALDEHRITK